MNSALTFRLLTETDAGAFRQLRLRACQEEPTAFLQTYEEIKDKPPEYFAGYFKNGWISGAFMKDDLVGMAGLFPQKGQKLEHKGIIGGVYVAPEMRGQGAAQSILRLLLEKAQAVGLELIHLSTNIKNPVSIALYKSLGFEEWGVDKHIMKVDGEYVDDMLMRKFLQ